MSIRYRNVAQLDRSHAIIEIDFDGVVRHWDYPEKTVGRDTRTVVMNLLEDIGRSYRTGVEVESDKHEGTMMVVAIFSNVFALHGSHVSAKRERSSNTGSSSATSDHGVGNQTVEVADLGRITDAG